MQFWSSCHWFINDEEKKRVHIGHRHRSLSFKWLYKTTSHDHSKFGRPTLLIVHRDSSHENFSIKARRFLKTFSSTFV